METTYLLVLIAIALVVVATWALFWAVKNDQFDDLEGPAHQVLYDDEESTADARRTPSKSQEGNPGPPASP